MRKISSVLVLLSLLLVGSIANAQIVNAIEIPDPTAQKLQMRNMANLRALAHAIQGHQYPYPFYFSRVLDIGQRQMAHLDQNSIRFDRFEGEMMLAVTGNYYASFAVNQVDRNDRVRDVLKDVVTPLLQAAIPIFEKDDSFTGFAFEISYPVREKALGGMGEHAENAVFVFPRAAALHFIRATTDGQRQAAMLDSKVFLNTEPFTLWIGDDRPSDEEIAKLREARQKSQKLPSTDKVPGAVTPPNATVASSLIDPAQVPSRIILPRNLAELSSRYAPRIASMQHEVGEQAHFVSYSGPAFIGFHQGIYLQLPVATVLDPTVSGSRYKLAALAFDDHIAHLIRPILAYFQSSTDFDGLVFSATITQAGKVNATAVEYFVPFTAVKCYAQYDCTGQQLLDAGIVLINGERSTINLQFAEAESSPANR